MPSIQSIARHEHRIADSLNVAPGGKVLDIGSGVGGPAREIAQHGDFSVTGITINEYQVCILLIDSQHIPTVNCHCSPLKS